jgi:predicted O-methyltransferase YrrM
MAILDENVKRYLTELRPERSYLMAEMEAVAERDSVPIVPGEPRDRLEGVATSSWPSRCLACVLPVGDGSGFGARRAAS